MALVVQSFGNETEYKRAVFTILSYYTHHRANTQTTILYTDNPAYFLPFFGDLPVRYELLTPERIREMRGEIDFLHRMKIAMIEHAFNVSGQDILYVDSDTFFLGDTNGLLKQLSASCSFMHLEEYVFESLMEMELPAGQPFHDFVNQIRFEKITNADGSFLSVSDKQYSWNAGAMILHRSVLNLLPDVYALTHQFYRRSKNHASEQYAFSIVLQNTVQLKSCDEAVYHYWHRVKKRIVDIFLSQHITSDWEKKQLNIKLDDVGNWTAILPDSFRDHVLTLQDNAIQAFCKNNFGLGYKFAIRAIFKASPEKKFFRDILYHTKRLILFRR